MLTVEADLYQSRVSLFEDQKMVEVEVENHCERSLVGNVYKGRVNRVLPGLQAAFVDVGLERDAFLFVDDAPAPAGVGDVAAAGIGDVLKGNQEIIVQVTKEPLPNKGARVTSRPSLAGRYLVLLPGGEHIGLSRRLEEESERARLEALAEELRPPGSGLIVRTQAADSDRADLEADLAELEDRWQRIEAAASAGRPPCLLHGELDLVQRSARDLLSEEIDEVWVDSEATFERVSEIVRRVEPRLLDRVKVDRSESGIARFGVEKEIDAALQSRVWLRSGGYLVINPTEALVAIDVNTGRFVGKTTLEETVLKTNLEAVGEIVRQIRLRDLGGIVVIDLIDMEKSSHRQQVFAALEKELERDRAKTKVLEISEIGLVQMTRKRSRSNLRGALTRPCPHCRGGGVIRSVAAVCIDLHREAVRRSTAAGAELVLRVNPEIASALRGSERALVEDLEGRLEARVTIEGIESLHHEHFQIRVV
jgi:ribonuclease G